MRAAIIVILAAAAVYGQVEPLTGPSYISDRAKLNRNLERAVVRDANGNVVVPGTLSVGRAVPAGAPASSISASCIANPHEYDVKCFGALGTGFPAIDTSAFQATLDAACAAGSTATPPKVIISSSPAYYYINGAGLTIPCDYLEIEGRGGYISYAYNGTPNTALWNISGKVGTHIHHVIMNGDDTNPNWAVKITTFSAMTSIGPKNVFNAFGNSTAGSAGGGILNTSDTNSLHIIDNLMTLKGTGVKSTGPLDAADISINNITSTVGRCMDFSGNDGATTTEIRHNNITCAGGGIKASGNGEYFIDDNEYELATAINATVNTTSSAYEFVNGFNGTVTRNRCNPLSNLDYCYYTDDSIVTSKFRDNKATAFDVAAFRNGSGTAQASVLYEGNEVIGAGTLYTQTSLVNCSSAASPAVCGSAENGSVVIAASATAVVVNTAKVTANSQIFVQWDSSLGTKLGVTCNTTPTLAAVTARTPGTSFTITTTAPTTNPACFSFAVIN